MLATAIASLSGSAALAQPPVADPALFTCRVIVTGTDMRTRPDALARCLRNVVVKVTGRPGLAEDRRVAAIEARAPDLIEDIVYLDRMTDIPKHDEQGTRDRPFDLIAHVDPAKLLAELAGVGLKPWTDRPTLLVVVRIARGREDFVLSADGDLGERQRQALLGAGETYGVRVSLLTADQLGGVGGRGPKPDDVPVARGGKGVVVLNGSLKWSDADFGWNAEWQIIQDGAAKTWQVRGVSFDEAFRSGVGGAANTLAGER